jgi:hypothetical protein
MTPDHSPIWPWAFAVLIPVLIYRRLRRSFGRQPMKPARMIVRMVILGILALSLVPVMLGSANFALAGAIGLACGIGLALWGASRTRFLNQNGQLYYVPHTYAGIAISLLVLGRLAYRLAQVYSAGGFGNATPHASGSAEVVQSPLTVGILFVLIGYYVCYYGWLLKKAKHVTPADLEVPAAPSAAETPVEGDVRGPSGPPH